MTKDEILALICTNQSVRDYLRGVEEGSELDRDAMREMRVAISVLRAGGVRDVMAEADPDLYGDTCLAYCELRTDSGNANADSIRKQLNDGIVLLRSASENKEEEVV